MNSKNSQSHHNNSASSITTTPTKSTTSQILPSKRIFIIKKTSASFKNPSTNLFSTTSAAASCFKIVSSTASFTTTASYTTTTPTASSSSSTITKSTTNNTTLTAPTPTKLPFIPKKITFDNKKDVILCREVIGVQLFGTKKASNARVRIWEDVSEKMNTITGDSMSPRTCRDRLTRLMESFKRKDSNERKGSGISPPFSELDGLLQDLCDLEREAKIASETVEKRRKESQEKGEIMRKRCLESIGETNAREGVEIKKRKERCDKKNPSRGNSEGILNYLQQKKAEDKLEKDKQFML